jgi:hypothetical protein
MRNRIINGAMMIDQRYAGSANTIGGGSYVLDRWLGANATDGTISIQQVADAPSGFYNSMKFTVGTADTSIGSSQYSFFRQAIEGYNVADLDWGLSTAKSATLSFWVKSNLTGLFSGNLASTGHDRCSAFTYTINAANTWEYKTVTITGDTTGTWNKTNSVGAYLHFALAVGSTYVQSATNTFQAGTFLGYTGTTNLFATSGNTFQITGVQLEKGSAASAFEQLQYGHILALCQRYFEKSYDTLTAPGTVTSSGVVYATITSDSAGSLVSHVSFSVPKRTGPTITLYNASFASTTGTWRYARSGVSETSYNMVSLYPGTRAFSCYGNTVAAWTPAYQYGHWTADAEL